MTLPGDALAAAIAASGLSIYHDPSASPGLFYDIELLEARLDAGLRGLRLDYPIRTRAKVAKGAVARLLGYPAPRSFAKTRPRFPGQCLDVFVQKADNLQVWNEDVDPTRRYALLRVDEAGRVAAVRVLTGEAIALLDRTGTLTSKYQAKRRPGRGGSTLVTAFDTDRFRQRLAPSAEAPPDVGAAASPVARPKPGAVLPVAAVHERLLGLVGTTFDDPGLVQERGRGIAWQRLVCAALGAGPYADAGQFPDVLCQALEVKLQLSPTIDLGLVTPDSPAIAEELGRGLRHCDVRYAVAYASRLGPTALRIDAVVTSTGEAFFDEFQRFEGLVRNVKRQIPLPAGLFEAKRPPDEVIDFGL